MVDIAGIILAGGRSSRMGRDKALLSLPNEKQTTFLEQLVGLLTQVCSEVVLVVRDEDQACAYAPLLAASVHVVTDAVPDTGPLMGLWSGLHSISASHALVTAVDTPFLQSELLAFLLAQPLDDALLVPVIAAVPQILLAVYPRSLLPVIEARLHAGRRDPRSLLQSVPVRYLSEDQLKTVDPQLRSFLNVNTPGDLTALD